jgi:alcohol dehydrogenase class IV
MLVGGGTAKQMPQLLGRLGAKNPFIVTDNFLAGNGTVAEITDALDADNISHRTFSDTIPDPTTESVDKVLDAMNSGSYDCIIAVGGGSPMDTAKAVAMLHTEGVGASKMRDYKAPFMMDKPVMPVIAVPTTAGTGSEVTKVTIISDSESGEKMLCMGLSYQPTACVVDYTLTMSKPYRLTADTGIDAMCHALEAYVSKKANPFSDKNALAALEAIGEHLVTACEDGQNHKAREAMMLASTQAGIAFSNASVTLVHGMSRPLGAHFHVPHGMSNAMLVPKITEWSVESSVERYATAARVLGMAAPDSGDQDAADGLAGKLYAQNTHLKVPTLQEFGVEADTFKSLIPEMSVQAIASGSPANNPRVPNAEEVEGIYKDIWAREGKQMKM